MSELTLWRRYAAVCKENGIKVNPDVVRVLRKTTVTENFSLTLNGNSRKARVQRMNDGDTLALTHCLRDNKLITGLDIRYNNITDDGARHIADLLQSGSAVQCLDLMFNDIQTRGAEVLSKSLQANSCLLSLKLSGNKIRNAGAMFVAHMLQINNTIQQIEMADCDLATQSVIALAIVLKSNKSLLSVDISRPLLFSHQEEWAVHFSEMLSVNRTLKELHLGKMGLTDTGMERLTEGLMHNHTLRYLDLRCNQVTRDGVGHLSRLLLQNRNSLRAVDLSANRIEDDGAVYLSEVIRQPGSNLRELSITCNNIGTLGLLSLSEALTVSPTLTHLYIWGNHLDEPVCLAYRDLLVSGRLCEGRTDLSWYQVDGRVFLSKCFNRLKRHYDITKGECTEICVPVCETTSACDANANPNPNPNPVPLQPC